MSDDFEPQGTPRQPNASMRMASAAGLRASTKSNSDRVTNNADGSGEATPTGGDNGSGGGARAVAATSNGDDGDKLSPSLSGTAPEATAAAAAAKGHVPVPLTAIVVDGSFRATSPLAPGGVRAASTSPSPSPVPPSRDALRGPSAAANLSHFQQQQQQHQQQPQHFALHQLGSNINNSSNVAAVHPQLSPAKSIALLRTAFARVAAAHDIDTARPALFDRRIDELSGAHARALALALLRAVSSALDGPGRHSSSSSSSAGSLQQMLLPPPPPPPSSQAQRPPLSHSSSMSQRLSLGFPPSTAQCATVFAAPPPPQPSTAAVAPSSLAAAAAAPSSLSRSYGDSIEGIAAIDNASPPPRLTAPPPVRPSTSPPMPLRLQVLPPQAAAAVAPPPDTLDGSSSGALPQPLRWQTHHFPPPPPPPLLLRQGSESASRSSSRVHRLGDAEAAAAAAGQPFPFRQRRLESAGSFASALGRQRSIRQTTSLERSVDNEGFKTINDYTLLELLGKGTSGKVKLAMHHGTNESRAIKIVRRSLVRKLQGANGLERLRKEVAIMKKLRHRNIVTLHEVIDDVRSDKLYTVMQYVEHGPVLPPLDDDDSCVPLPEARVVLYVRQAAAGLVYLHNHGIAHLDVKPANLLLGGNDCVYLSDFGISELMTKGDSSIVRPSGLGTPAFMAPELCSGDTPEVDGEAADTWALGVTAFLMLFGRLPFRGPTLRAVFVAILSDEPQLPPSATATQRDFFARVLCKDPAQRARLRNLRRHAFLDRGGISNNSFGDGGGGGGGLALVDSVNEAELQSPTSVSDVGANAAAATTAAAGVGAFHAGASQLVSPRTERLRFISVTRSEMDAAISVVASPASICGEEVVSSSPASDDDDDGGGGGGEPLAVAATFSAGAAAAYSRGPSPKLPPPPPTLPLPPPPPSAAPPHLLPRPPVTFSEGSGSVAVPMPPPPLAAHARARGESFGPVEPPEPPTLLPFARTHRVSIAAPVAPLSAEILTAQSPLQPPPSSQSSLRLRRE